MVIPVERRTPTENKTTMKTENDQPICMNSFIVTAILPGGRVATIKAHAIDKSDAKKAVWHCHPHAIIESVESF